MIGQAFGWAALMILTGIVTARLHGVIEPLIPAGDWHAALSRIFVIVTWPLFTWSLRRFASPCLLDFFPAFFWW
jgi:hypothetical protein